MGVLVTIDKLTKEKERCSYARVLIHVDASKDVVRSFWVINPDGSSYTQRVVYEFEPRYCAHCKSVTHKTSSCQHSNSTGAPRRKGRDSNSSRGNSQHPSQKPSGNIPGRTPPSCAH